MSVLKASEANWKLTAAASSPGNTHSAGVRAAGAFFRVACECLCFRSCVCSVQHRSQEERRKEWAGSFSN